MSRTLWQFDDVIKKCKETHNNYYEYLTSKDAFNGIKYPLLIKCPVHGEFYQEARRHMQGQRCKKCSQFKYKSIDDVIHKCNEVHKNYYDYLNVNDYKNYQINARVLLKAHCPKHGYFEILSDHHIAGQKCKQCKVEERLHAKLTEIDKIIKDASNIHNNKYSYHAKDFATLVDKRHYIMSATCYEHGLFYINAKKHLAGQICPKCSNNLRKAKIKSTVHTLIKSRSKIKQSWQRQITDCKMTHSNEYEYFDEPEDFTSHTVIPILCKTHGIFYRPLHSHKAGAKCPACNAMNTGVSNAETDLFNFLKMYCNDAEQSNRTVIKPKELDIFVRSKNIGIEYNGLYWHRNNKHNCLDKLNLCNDVGVKLINVFEDEWLNKREILQSRIRSIINSYDNIIYARKCKIKQISYKEAKLFFDSNHMQGFAAFSLAYGLYYNGVLVSAMSFCSYRKNLGRTKRPDEYELLRFCNALNTKVIGGASKLFKHFVKTKKPTQVISYADRRFSTGDLYYKLGFDFVHYTRPNYFYVKDFIRHNRFGFAKHKLVQQGFSKDLTEEQIMLDRGYYKIYDCGNMLFSICF